VLSHRKIRSRPLVDVDEEQDLRPIRSAFVCQLLYARMIDDGLSRPDKADTVTGLDMVLSPTYAVKIGVNHGFAMERTFYRSAECS